MFLTKLSLPRRTFLRGMGATVALPFLEAMVPAMTATAKTAANPPRRWGAVFFPNGAIMEQWSPAAVGTGFDFSPSLKPLEGFRDSLVVVSNLTRAGTTARRSRRQRPGTADRGGAKSEIKTCGRTRRSIRSRRSRSVRTRRSHRWSWPRKISPGAWAAPCTVGFSCVRQHDLMEHADHAVADGNQPARGVRACPASRARRRRRRAHRQRDLSILDVIAEEASALQRGLGARDRTRFTQYLDNIREIERRIQRTEDRNSAQVTTPDAPVGIPESFEEHVGLMFDLLTVAYQADLTRVFTFMMSRELSQRTYPQIGVPDQHHGVSHHGNDPEKIAKVAKINAYHARLFATFLERLRSTPDGDGSVLDHSLIFFGGGMGNPNQHAVGPLPMVVAGGGVARRDRHLALPASTPVGNLWLTVANKFDNPMEKFGESTGTIDLF